MKNYFNWPGQLWFISDLHFGHNNILTFERTEFNSIEEHDETIVKRINSKVSEWDTLICLGDLGYTWKENFDKIKRSKKRILIKGNHDYDKDEVYLQYFDEVYDGPVFLNKKIVLSHQPVNLPGNYFLNIHGHLHGSYLDDEEILHKNVSAAMIDYFPIPMKDIEELIGKYPKNSLKERFMDEWYSDKYQFTGIRDDCFMYCDNFHIIPQERIEKAMQMAKIELGSVAGNDFNDFTNFYKTTKRLPIRTKNTNFISTDSDEEIKNKLIEFWKENK